MTGSWVDVNRSGVTVFEKQVGGFYQVFKAWPLEPRNLSTLATNALVGFPWQADADNIVEAYGGEPEAKPTIGDPLVPLSARHILWANALMFLTAVLFVGLCLAVRLAAVGWWTRGRCW